MIIFRIIGVFSKIINSIDKSANEISNLHIETNIETFMIIIDYSKFLKNNSFYFGDFTNIGNKTFKSEKIEDFIVSLKIEVIFHHFRI